MVEPLKVFKVVSHKTPVFMAPALTSELSRVCGAKLLREKGVYIFPAVYPFGLIVLDDLNIVTDNNLDVTPGAQAYLDYLKEVEVKVAQEYLDPGFSFITEPRAHQRTSVALAAYHPRFAILLGCGLGKTKVAIDLIRYLRFIGEPYRTLIVAPPIVLEKWEYEFEKHSENDFKLFRAHGPKQKLAEALEVLEPEDVDVVLTTHTTARFDHVVPHLDRLDLDAIIIDEAHKLKSPGSATTNELIALVRGKNRRHLLSGTVVAGNPRHLYGPLKFMGDFLVEPSKYLFDRRFLQFLDPKSPDKIKRNIVVGYRNLEILQKRLDRISIRRKPDDCEDLPPLRTIDVDYDLSSEQKSLYNELVRAYPYNVPEKFNIREEGFYAVRINKLSQILSGFYMRNIEEEPEDEDGDVEAAEDFFEEEVKPKKPETEVVQLASNPKLDHLKLLVDDILAEESNKVVIWARHKKELEDIQEAVSDYKFASIGGKSKSYAPAMAFDRDPDTRILVGQISMGEGFDAVSANYAIYYSADFDLMKYGQSRDRVYRIGQTRKVTVYRFRCKDSLEDFVYKVLEYKADVSDVLVAYNYCMICAQQDECLKADITMFSDGCSIQLSGERLVATPREIK